MKKNLEIKYRIENPGSVRSLLKRNNKFTFTSESQTDIYYKVPKGRLKLRIINGKKCQLIFYERNEKKTERISNYIISETNNISELESILKKVFDIIVTVKKHREIFIRDNIRIHLDKVKGLGSFLEIEIIYNNIHSAKKQLNEISEYIRLNKKNNFIKNSYSDLLIKRK